MTSNKDLASKAKDQQKPKQLSATRPPYKYSNKAPQESPFAAKNTIGN